MDATLVTLGQPEPALQIEVVLYLIHRVPAGEKADPEAGHQLHHVLVDCSAVALNAGKDRLIRGLTRGACACAGVQRRGDRLDFLDVVPDRFLNGLDRLQTLVDARGQPAQLRLREAPLFASRVR